MHGINVPNELNTTSGECKRRNKALKKVTFSICSDPDINKRSYINLY